MTNPTAPMSNNALNVRDNTIVIFAGDNGRDTSFQGPGNRSAHGPWRGGYFQPTKATIERSA